MNDQEQIYIVRCGETSLKGQNKPYFERMLQQRIQKVLKDYGGCRAERLDGLLFLRIPPSVSREDLLRRVGRVFGVDSISPAREVDIQGLNDEEAVEKVGLAAVEWMSRVAEEGLARTFKVEAKRVDKRFSIQSPRIASMIGGRILRTCKGFSVDVHDPDCTLHTDFRRGVAHIYDEKISGYGGLPLGTNGKGLVLLSGGIDSPVAAFLMAHRGMLIEAVHFHSFPYTSQRAWEKVKELGAILTLYCGEIRIHSINLLPVQEQIAERCPPEEMTLLVRRFMMKIAQIIARENGCSMLITGENLGQVASQTADALVVTDQAVSLPVMRPLIAMDKADIIRTARQIGTFETSILPYEDCCTVFLPKHPCTRPRLQDILDSEALLDESELIELALKSGKMTILDSREEL